MSHKGSQLLSNKVRHALAQQLQELGMSRETGWDLVPAEAVDQTFCEATQEPDVVGDEVGHVVVQPLQHAEDVVYVEDGVVVAIQHPLVAVCSQAVVRQERRHCCPACIPAWGARYRDSRHGGVQHLLQSVLHLTVIKGG